MSLTAKHIQFRKLDVAVKLAVLARLLGISSRSPAARVLPPAEPLVTALPGGVTGADVQRVRDSLPATGGEVVLPPGKIDVSQPIVLKRDHETPWGSGKESVLSLADNDDQFDVASISNRRHYGIFKARTDVVTSHGAEQVPHSAWVRNSFTNLAAINCGSAAFRVNTVSCGGNVLVGAQFENNANGGLSLMKPGLVAG